MQLYGIKNCDRCRAARKWLDANGLRVNFVDVREQPASARELARWAKKLGWQNLLNRMSKSWRELPANSKKDIDELAACQLITSEPRLMKRPLLVRGKQVHVGFTPEHYAEIFGVSRR